MWLQNVLGFALLGASSINVLAVPVADLANEISPSLQNGLLPRAADCTCCLPASTIVLTSTKLLVTNTVSTIYTTPTATKNVAVKGTTTLISTVTEYSVTSITSTSVGATVCTPSSENLVKQGGFDEAPNFSSWTPAWEGIIRRDYIDGGSGVDGSNAFYVLGTDGSSDHWAQLGQALNLCPGAGYTLTSYFAFEEGDATCTHSILIGDRELFSVHPSPETATHSDPPPWTKVSVDFVALAEVEWIKLKIACPATRGDYVYLDSVSVVRNDNAVVKTTTTVTRTSTPPSLTSVASVTVEGTTHTTYTLLGGTKFWKRDAGLVPRAPLVTATDCACTNVECMTAVASTLKTTITSTSVNYVTKPYPTGVLVINTVTQWKTLSVNTPTTTVIHSTIYYTVTEAATYTLVSIPTKAVTKYTTVQGDSPPSTIIETVATTVDFTKTITYTQAAYYPSATIAIRVADEGGTTGQWENKDEPFAIDRCAQSCAVNPACYDWTLRSDNGDPFGSRNPPDRYCLWYGQDLRFDASDPSFILGGFPWVTDTVVYKRVDL